MRKSDCKGTALYSQCQACYRGLINIENNTRKRAETLFFDHSKDTDGSEAGEEGCGSVL